MVLLGGLFLHMGEENIYVVEVVCECIHWEHFGVSATNRSKYIFAMRILGYPGMQASILTFWGSLQTSALAILPYLCPSSGVNEPSI